MQALGMTLRQTAKLFRSQRRLWLPFLVCAFVEALFIGLLWLAPHPPFSKLLAPPVRYFFGDRMLHYPSHLWFLYYAMKHTHVITSILIGAFFTGVACAMVRQTHEGVALSLRTALVSGGARYGTVTAVWLVTWALANGIVEGWMRFASKAAWLPWAVISSTVLLQALLVYAIPAAVFNESPWWKALFQSVREAVRYPLSTLAVVALPSAAVILSAVFASPARVAQWMTQTSPEIAIPCVIGRLLVWTVADALLTVGIAHLWCFHRVPHHALECADTPARSSLSPGQIRPLTGLAMLLLVALTTSGCSASYQGERLFWRAKHLSAQIAKDPSHASPEQFATAIAAFGTVIQNTPGTEWAASAQLAIGSLYQRHREYGKAREAYELILRDYDAYKPTCAKALVAIGQTYEAQQNWEAAEQAYWGISTRYPWTAIGLESPLYAAQMHERRGDSQQSNIAYAHAVDVYTKLIAQAPMPGLLIRVKSHLALAYQRLGNWDLATTTLRELAKAQDEGVNHPLVLMALGTIYETKTGDLAKAGEAYTEFLKEFPEHPLGKVAKYRLQHLSIMITPQPVSPTPPKSP